MWVVSNVIPLVHWTGQGHFPILLVNYREYLDIWADKYLCPCRRNILVLQTGIICQRGTTSWRVMSYLCEQSAKISPQSLG